MDLQYNFSKTNKCLFIFCIEGSFQIATEMLSLRDAIGIWGTEQIEIQALTNSELIIIETPINQK